MLAEFATLTFAALVAAGVGDWRAWSRKRAKVPRQTPYANRTPEANDASTAQTRTTESLTETFLYFRLLQNEMQKLGLRQEQLHCYKSEINYNATLFLGYYPFGYLGLEAPKAG